MESDESLLVKDRSDIFD